MPEDAWMLAEAFAVVRGDDQPCTLEASAVFQLVDQTTQAFVEVGDAVVISIGGQGDLLVGRLTGCQ